MGGQICITCALRELETESLRSEFLKFHGDQEEDGADHDRNRDLGADDEGEETLDVVLSGRPVSFSPMIVLQPNPFVFYRDKCGDQVIFQFLWFSMRHCLSEIKLIPNDQNSAEKKDNFSHYHDSTFRELAASSAMNIPCFDCGVVKNIAVWAFSTWCGRHILVAADFDSKSSQTSLYVRGDELNLLRYCTETEKEVFIHGLTKGKWCAN